MKSPQQGKLLGVEVQVEEDASAPGVRVKRLNCLYTDRKRRISESSTEIVQIGKAGQSPFQNRPIGDGLQLRRPILLVQGWSNALAQRRRSMPSRVAGA